MEKQELVDALNEIVGDFSGALLKMEFIRLKDDLTLKENKVIDNFCNKILAEKEKIEEFQKKVVSLDNDMDDSIKPILMLMKIDAKRCHTSALRAVRHFYPD